MAPIEYRQPRAVGSSEPPKITLALSLMQTAKIKGRDCFHMRHIDGTDRVILDNITAWLCAIFVPGDLTNIGFRFASCSFNGFRACCRFKHSAPTIKTESEPCDANRKPPFLHTQNAPFITSIFLSPKSTLVVKIKEGSPGRSQMLVPGCKDAMLVVIKVILFSEDLPREASTNARVVGTKLEMLTKTTCNKNKAGNFIDENNT
jgi:hypothetical protein